MTVTTIIPKVREKQKVANVLAQHEIEGKSLHDLDVGIGDYIVLINGYEVGDSTMVPNLNRLTQYAGAVIIDDANPCRIQIIKRGHSDDDAFAEDEVFMVCKDRLNNKLVVTDNHDTFEKAGYSDLEVGFYKDERFAHYDNVKELHEDGYEGWDESEYHEYCEELANETQGARSALILKYEKEIKRKEKEVIALKKKLEQEQGTLREYGMNYIRHEMSKKWKKEKNA